MDDQDKTDPASEYKLRKARERGSVAKSQDVVYAALLMAAAALVTSLGTALTGDLIKVLRAVMSKVGNSQADPALLFPLFTALTYELARIMAMPALVLVIVAVLGSLVQVGFVISFEPLKPDFERLNPAQGLKKLFSTRSTFELLRSTAKISLVGAAVYFYGPSVMRHLMTLPEAGAQGLAIYLLDTMGWMLMVLAGLFLLFAAMDYFYNRWEFLKRMKMSKQEVKDEYKQREGDPRVKSRLRELRLEWLKKSRALSKVGDADMLLTNPTHLAIAVAYKRGAMQAPVILAKGAGSMARKMKAMARAKHVVVIENVPLTRAMYPLVQPDGALPERFYVEVARLLAWVFAARTARPSANP